jgi:hypothetical protein
LVYLLRISCVDGCVIILYKNAQQDANNEDKESASEALTSHVRASTMLLLPIVGNGINSTDIKFIATSVKMDHVIQRSKGEHTHTISLVITLLNKITSMVTFHWWYQTIFVPSNITSKL